MTEEKQKTFKILKQTYCRIQPSAISGVGVFAIRDIPANVDLFVGQKNQKWLRYKIEELKKLDKAILEMTDAFFVIEKDKTVLIPELGLNGMDMSFYLNHSKNPNAKTIDGGLIFISLRKIKKGEEITVDYASYDYKYAK